MKSFYAFDIQDNYRPCTNTDPLEPGWDLDVFADLFASPLKLKLYEVGEVPFDAESRLQELLRVKISAYYPDDDNTKNVVKFAWPQEILYESIDKCMVMGFSMPAIDPFPAIKLQQFHDDDARKAAGFSYEAKDRLAVAQSLAAAMVELNAARVYVPNLHDRTVFVYKNNQVAITACDEFGFKANQRYYPGGLVDAEIGSPEYYGQEIAVEEADIAQGLFALGVQIFKLLNLGIHPFDGVLREGVAKPGFPAKRVERIAAGYYPYGIISHPCIAPISDGSIHEHFPLELCELFDRCFLGPSDSRPSSVEWRSYLVGLDALTLMHNRLNSVKADSSMTRETSQGYFASRKLFDWLIRNKIKCATVIVGAVFLAGALTLTPYPKLQDLISQYQILKYEMVAFIARDKQ